MKARIYRPAKSAMQSGTARTRQWVLEFLAEHRKTIDPLMGWTGSQDMQRQVHLTFDTREEAESYAKRHGIDYNLRQDHKRKRIIRSYADNFTGNP